MSEGWSLTESDPAIVSFCDAYELLGPAYVSLHHMSVHRITV